jgi:hypothetical protein
MQLARMAARCCSYVALAAAMAYFIKNEPWNYQEIAIAADIDRPSPAIFPIVADMKLIANTGTYQRYQLSPALQLDALIVQRSVEFLYPIRIVGENAPIFASTSEAIPENCRVLAKRDAAFAYVCE